MSAAARPAGAPSTSAMPVESVTARTLVAPSDNTWKPSPSWVAAEPPAGACASSGRRPRPAPSVAPTRPRVPVASKVLRDSSGNSTPVNAFDRYARPNSLYWRAPGATSEESVIASKALTAFPRVALHAPTSTTRANTLIFNNTELSPQRPAWPDSRRRRPRRRGSCSGVSSVANARHVVAARRPRPPRRGRESATSFSGAPPP